MKKTRKVRARQLTFKKNNKEFRIISMKNPLNTSRLSDAISKYTNTTTITRPYGSWSIRGTTVRLYLSIHPHTHENLKEEKHQIKKVLDEWIFDHSTNNMLDLFLKGQELERDDVHFEIITVCRGRKKLQEFYECVNFSKLLENEEDVEFKIPVTFSIKVVKKAQKP